MGLTDQAGPPPKTYLLERGELANQGERGAAGLPQRCSARRQAGRGEGRRASEQHRPAAGAGEVDRIEDNPLTARVIVNRLWQHHFGKGIVATAERLRHPRRAADAPGVARLAGVRTGRAASWSLKQMHRADAPVGDVPAIHARNATTRPRSDPDNNLFSRMNRQRLEGEAIRDALLAISGRLNPKMGGPGVVLPDVVACGRRLAARCRSRADDEGVHPPQRLPVLAAEPSRYPFLEAFDLPDSNLSCPEREKSTTAPQALALLELRRRDDRREGAGGAPDEGSQDARRAHRRWRTA